ncbi:2-amino-4-hydroxy-6-hydroxymethyldihydropteridine diphosphokinase [Pseudolactococcus insecticola]|uniref:2-amino-4-hydroxy-6-hydroxymethyldihydropteridine diphosphokinase n=1 Tax=Pseudolactococcus insecticola TaxID=2709158 RepID=A0A6A0B6F8_9LACT|nr:2-amino-4-hydroxy-6-hydroxymethyldihydropteridine diphosphokinase [Lactococcus insecticola]GFH40526.1 2-amino-4-hydroxy-6-hydroxymethyldihydropteridine diphosphokinase [Lactococcus insecticola]
MTKVYLSIGTNLGDRLANLQEAVVRLAADFDVLGVSKVYETEPVGLVIQDDFYNITLVLEVAKEVTPEQLLDKTQAIEKAMKRVKTVHWGPRTIDLDILLFGGVNLTSERLSIPHRELANRRFVLQPLLDVAEQISDDRVVTLSEQLLQTTSDENWVRATPYQLTIPE